MPSICRLAQSLECSSAETSGYSRLSGGESGFLLAVAVISGEGSGQRLVFRFFSSFPFPYLCALLLLRSRCHQNRVALWAPDVAFLKTEQFVPHLGDKLRCFI